MDGSALTNLTKIGAPQNSTTLMPSMFINDEAWTKVAPVLSQGDYAIPVSFSVV